MGEKYRIDVKVAQKIYAIKTVTLQIYEVSAKICLFGERRSSASDSEQFQQSWVFAR